MKKKKKNRSESKRGFSLAGKGLTVTAIATGLPQECGISVADNQQLRGALTSTIIPL